MSEILLNNVSSKCVRYGSVKNGFGDTSVEISAVAVGLSGLVYLAEPYITRDEPVAFVRFQIQSLKSSFKKQKVKSTRSFEDEVDSFLFYRCNYSPAQTRS